MDKLEELKRNFYRGFPCTDTKWLISEVESLRKKKRELSLALGELPDLRAQLAKYREALEKIYSKGEHDRDCAGNHTMNECDCHVDIARQALSTEGPKGRWIEMRECRTSCVGGEDGPSLSKCDVGDSCPKFADSKARRVWVEEG